MWNYNRTKTFIGVTYMELKMNEAALAECLEVMEEQEQRMKYCYEEFEGFLCKNKEEFEEYRKMLCKMEEEILKVRALRRKLERILICTKRWEGRLLSCLEGSQGRSKVAMKKVSLVELADYMKELEIWSK